MTSKKKVLLPEIKHAAKSILYHIMNENHDIEQTLKYSHYLLRMYHEDNEHGFTQDILDYLPTFFYKIVSKLLSNRKFINFRNNLNHGDEIAYCCQYLIRIGCQLIKSDSPLSVEIIHHCLNAKSPFYHCFGLDHRQNRGSKLTKFEARSLKHWRDHCINVGQYVDYLIDNRWQYGVITNIKEIINSNKEKFHVLVLKRQLQQTDNDSTETSFVEDTFKYQENLTHRQICQPFTKSVQYLPHMLNWRKNLSINSKCDLLLYPPDSCSETAKWIRCVVTQVDQFSNRIRVKHELSEIDKWKLRYTL